MARFLKGVADYLTPVLKTSAFTEKGVLTPEEFVAAGDELVFKCPTWEWCAGDPASAKSFLPPGKQFLVTRGVPCQRRVSSLESEYAVERAVVDADGVDGDNEWLEPQVPEGGGGDGVVDTVGADGVVVGAADSAAPAVPAGASLLAHVVDDHVAVPSGAETAGRSEPAGSGSGGGAGVDVGADDDDDEYADMTSFEEDNLVVADEATLGPGAAAGAGAGAGGDSMPYLRAVEPTDNILRTRTYDMYITYDKFYQTPHVYFTGYNERRDPLTPDEIMQDIMQDYAKKTVSLEPHPHLPADGPHASVHPCRHAAVMTRIIAALREGGKEPLVQHYLFYFLKFLQSVVPTMDYDHTIEMEAKAGV